jgi:hypothetical protein
MSVLKRILPFILVLAAGYALGYQDAYRGPKSLGWKLGDLMDRMTPESVRAERAKNAEAIRQKQRENAPAVPE